MLRTKKLLSLVQRELDGLKSTIPLPVLQSLDNMDASTYYQLFGRYDAPYAIYIKNLIATPYSYNSDVYNRCRAKQFTSNSVSALEYYYLNSNPEKQLEITEYLKGNIEKISL